MRPPTRREVLRTSCTCVAVGAAGCLSGASPFDAEESDDDAREVNVGNQTKRRQIFRVTIEAPSGRSIFDREYDLAAGTADQSGSLVGEPETVTLTFDDGARSEHELFVDAECANPGLDIAIDDGRRPVFGANCLP